MTFAISHLAFLIEAPSSPARAGEGIRSPEHFFPVNRQSFTTFNAKWIMPRKVMITDR